jgi:hypothetical protein
MAELRPGKGAFLPLTSETIEFLHECITDVWNAAGVGTDEDPDFPSIDELIDDFKAGEYLNDLKASATHWVLSEDNFGIKLHKALPWDDGEIRVTVVLKNGKLKVDIRSWYDPDNINAKTPWSQK